MNNEDSSAPQPFVCRIPSSSKANCTRCASRTPTTFGTAAAARFSRTPSAISAAPRRAIALSPTFGTSAWMFPSAMAFRSRRITRTPGQGSRTKHLSCRLQRAVRLRRNKFSLLKILLKMISTASREERMAPASFNDLRVLALESRHAKEIAKLIASYGGRPLSRPPCARSPSIRQKPAPSPTRSSMANSTW